MKEKIIVNVKGVEYKIIFKENLIGYSGFTDNKKKEIVIEINKNSEEMMKTLIHELLHAYFYECGLEEYCNDEILVTWFEHHLFEIYSLAEDIFIEVI